MSIVNTRTRVNVPIIEAGFFGLNGMMVRIVMNKKYTFAALLNWKRSESGAHESKVYFVVLTLLDKCF